MFNILAFLFIFILAILFIGVSIVGSILRSLFGLGRHSQQGNTNANSSSRDYTFYGSQSEDKQADNAQKETNDQSQAKHKKIFDKSDGEYVDYEEVKE
ncbi:MAG: DUF4834 family protein [Bacteroides sp.]|jgi:Sec-independent protein translocase protein TatA|nr:DUF4834 family protein [Bacteroides sp.]